MYKIAICGKAKSGKNTTASIILEQLSLYKERVISSKTIAFADPIKEIILKMFPTAKEECLYGSSELRSNQIGPNLFDANGQLLTYRQALIDIGSSGRKYNSNIWVNCLDQECKRVGLIDALVVPDLRFVEELNYLKSNNFFIIKINREDFTKINHASETAQDGFDVSDFNFILDNNEDLLSLKDKIKKYLMPNLIKSFN